MILILPAVILAICVFLVVTRGMEVAGYVALGGVATLVGLLIPFSACDGRGCLPAGSNMLAWPFVTVAYCVSSVALSRRLRRPNASWPREVVIWGIPPLVTLTVCSELIRADGFGNIPHLWVAMAPAFAVLLLQGWRMGKRQDHSTD